MKLIRWVDGMEMIDLFSLIFSILGGRVVIKGIVLNFLVDQGDFGLNG